MDGRDKLQDSEYINFIKTLLCLSKTKEGLETFAHEKSIQFHQEVLDSLNQLNIANTGNPICTVSYDRKNTFSVACQDSFCKTFIKEVIRLAKPFTIQKFNFENSDHTLWHSNPWELSKIFMNRGQQLSQKCPKDTDLSGIVNFVEHCPVARSGISSTQKISKVREVRNKLMHKSIMTVDNNTFISMIKDLVALLEDTKELAGRPESQQAVEYINEVMKPDFQIEKHNEGLALEFMEKLNITMEKLKEVTQQVDSNSLQLKEIRTQLEDQVEQSKLKQQITERQNLIIKGWIDDDETFVETKAYKHIADEMMTKKFITITGVSGSGKTALARHIGIQLQKTGYILIPITGMSEIISSSVEPNQKHMYVLDDPVGTERVDTMKLADVRTNNDYIMILLKKCCMKIIFTCRKHIIQDSLLQNTRSIINMNIIDLNDKIFELTNDEKATMLQNHLNTTIKTEFKEYRVNISIIETQNFPLLSRLFAVNDQYRRQGQRFFEKHFDVILDDLNTLKEYGKLNYCCLILCMVYGNKFHRKYLDVFESPEKDRIGQLIEACKLSRDTSLKVIEDSMLSLESVYLTKIGDEYSFIHDTLYDAVAFSFGKDYPLELIKYCTSSFIRQNISLSSSEEGLHIVLAPEHYTEFSQRLIRDLKDGKFHDVFFGPLQDKKLHQNFLDCLRRLNQQEMEHILFETDIYIEDRALLYLGHQKLKHMLFETDTYSKEMAFHYNEEYAFKKLPIVNNLAHVSVKCIHFLLATGPHCISKYCLDVLDFSRLSDNLHLWPIVGLSGKENNFKMLQKNGYKGSLTEKWLNGNNLLHFASSCKNVNMLRMIMPHVLATINDCNYNGNSPLHEAAYWGHLDCVKVLLQHGASVDLSDRHGESPLHKAAKEGHLDCVHILLQHGASVDFSSLDGDSPLHKAAFWGHLDCVKVLLQHGASVDFSSHDGKSPLHKAAKEGHLDCVQVLLQHGASVDFSSLDGDSPLHKAAFWGHLGCLKVLLQHGASVDLGNHKGESPLHRAAYSGHLDCVEVLLQHGASVDLSSLDGDSPLHKAAFWGHLDCLHVLLQHGASVDFSSLDGKSPLHKASYRGHLECVQFLLQHGASVDLSSLHGDTPLHKAACWGHLDCLKVLLQHGASVDLGNHKGESPLHRAAYSGHLDCVQVLLQHGASVDFSNFECESPLHRAAYSGHLGCVQVLLQHGASVDLSSRFGASPLHIAAKMGTLDCVQVLLQHGASVDLVDVHGETPLHKATQWGRFGCVQVLLQHGASVDLGDHDGESPLHKAAFWGRHDCVRVLLQHGASVNLDNYKGESPLHRAAYSGHLDCVIVLLQHGASVDLVDHHGASPLHKAAEKGNHDCMQGLLQYGASVDLVDHHGASPLHKATEKGNRDCVQVLLQHGASDDFSSFESESPLH